MIKPQKKNLQSQVDFDYTKINTNRTGFTADQIFGDTKDSRPQTEHQNDPDKSFLTDEEASTSKNLWVSNIPNSMTQDEFDLVFWAIGEVESVRMVSHPDGQPKGFGFVEYTKREDAHSAIKFLNGRTFRGRQLIVKLTRPPGPKCRGRAPFSGAKKKIPYMQDQTGLLETLKKRIKGESEKAHPPTTLSPKEAVNMWRVNIYGPTQVKQEQPNMVPVIQQPAKLTKAHVISRGPVPSARASSPPKKTLSPPPTTILGPPATAPAPPQQQAAPQWEALNSVIHHQTRPEQTQTPNYNNVLLNTIRQQVVNATVDQIAKQSRVGTATISPVSPTMQAQVPTPNLQQASYLLQQPQTATVCSPRIGFPQSVAVPPGLGINQARQAALHAPQQWAFPQQLGPFQTQQTATLQQAQPWHRQAYKPY